MLYNINLILFLHYPNHLYIFFISCTFTSGTIPYALFFPCPSTFRLGEDMHTPDISKTIQYFLYKNMKFQCF
jgi:hypothetical protein